MTTIIILSFHGPLSGTTGELVSEETFTLSHLSWSSIVLYLLPPSTAIHSIHSVQFTCLTVFLHDLSPSPLGPLGLASSTSYSIHFFIQSLSSFCNTCSYHSNNRHTATTKYFVFHSISLSTADDVRSRGHTCQHDPTNIGPTRCLVCSGHNQQATRVLRRR